MVQISPPLLLHVTEEYCKAKIRVLVYGQETLGWEWNRKSLSDWPYTDLNNFSDFVSNDDSVIGLCWGYREFAFSQRNPGNRNSPFWQAFREVQAWQGIGVMWTNIARVNALISGQNGSFLNLPEHIKNWILNLQGPLVRKELSLLSPDVCVFFTGPYYDLVIANAFENCSFDVAQADVSCRELAKLSHPALPERSFRTYHPNFLSRSNKWSYIDRIRNLSF